MFTSPQFIHFMTLSVLFLPHYVGKSSLSINYFGFSARVYMRQGIKAGGTDVVQWDAWNNSRAVSMEWTGQFPSLHLVLVFCALHVITVVQGHICIKFKQNVMNVHSLVWRRMPSK